MSRSRSILRVALIGIVLLHTAMSQGAEIDQSKAAGIMAAYLRHIASFSNWPVDEIEENQPIRIGLIGADPNGVIALIRGRTESSEGLAAQGRPIHVVVLERTSDGEAALSQLSSCDLLFLSSGAEDRWQQVQPLVEALPIVTVSEMDGFVNRGGMVEYFIDRRSGKVRMKVNLLAMRNAGVSFSARFLALKSVILLQEGEEA